jgi:hypothetical protein
MPVMLLAPFDYPLPAYPARFHSSASRRHHRTLCDDGGEKFEFFKLDNDYFPWTDI